MGTKLLNEIQKSVLKKKFPRRSKDSHKGQNGRVLVIGGSIDYYGAPILSGLAALNSGADLVFLCVPECNFDVTRSFYPDFIVRKFPGEYLNNKAIPVVEEMAERCDVVVLGPGMGKEAGSLIAVGKILSRLTDKPVILDAEAIQVMKTVKGKQRNILISPHRKEFSILTEREVPELLADQAERVKDLAERRKMTVALKGAVDIVASQNGEVLINQVGNPGMTVGGTGDVLTGIIAAFVAQGLDLFTAAQFGVVINGMAAENLYKQKGYGYSATDLALEIPYMVKEIEG